MRVRQIDCSSFWDRDLWTILKDYVEDSKVQLKSEEDEAYYHFVTSTPAQLRKLFHYAKPNAPYAYFIAAQLVEQGFYFENVAAASVGLEYMASKSHDGTCQGLFDRDWEDVWAECMFHKLRYDKWHIRRIQVALSSLEPGFRSRASYEVLQAMSGLSLGNLITDVEGVSDAFYSRQH